MPKRLREILENGRYSFNDLWNLPRTREYEIEKTSESRVLIYNILLKGIAGNEGDNRLYTGKTVKSGNRFADHSSGLKEDSDLAGQMSLAGLQQSGG